ncbi:MAG: hypothetical protein KA160_02115 [Lacibacter sp.]|nr:hypothetical protein [Lacibacter sp.]
MQKFCFYSVLFFLFISISSFQQKNPKEKLNWISLEEAELKMKTEPAPFSLIFIPTGVAGAR